MNMKRRIFGLLLAICIAGGLLPVSTMPVAAATGHTVTIGGKEFITDSNGIMAYRYNNDAYDDYTFDIYGNKQLTIVVATIPTSKLLILRNLCKQFLPLTMGTQFQIRV